MYDLQPIIETFEMLSQSFRAAEEEVKKQIEILKQEQSKSLNK